MAFHKMSSRQRCDGGWSNQAESPPGKLIAARKPHAKAPPRVSWRISDNWRVLQQVGVLRPHTSRVKGGGARCGTTRYPNTASPTVVGRTEVDGSCSNHDMARAAYPRPRQHLDTAHHRPRARWPHPSHLSALGAARVAQAACRGHDDHRDLIRGRHIQRHHGGVVVHASARYSRAATTMRRAPARIVWAAQPVYLLL